MDPADTKRKSSENQFIRDETRQLRRAEETEVCTGSRFWNPLMIRRERFSHC